MGVGEQRAEGKPGGTPTISSSSSSRDKWWRESQKNMLSIMNLADLSKLERVSSRYRDIYNTFRGDFESSHLSPRY